MKQSKRTVNKTRIKSIVLHDVVQAADIAPASLLEARPWIKHYDPGVPPDVLPIEKTLPQLLRETAARFPNRSATIFFGARLSFKELDQAADRFAAGLVDIGVRPGDRVALLLPNCPQFLIAYFGALRAGAVVVPCNPTYVARELEGQFSDSGAKVIVTLTLFFNTIKDILPKTGVRRVIVGNIKDYFPAKLRAAFTVTKEKKEGHRVEFKGTGIFAWEQFLSSYYPVAPRVEMKPDDIALYQYTGGTTGVPKAAMLTHRNLATNAEMCRAWTGNREPGTDLTLGVIPFFHVYGMSVAMNMSIATGATLLLLPRFNPIEVLKAIHHYQPTLFPGVPAMYIALLNHPEVGRYRVNSIEVCLSGASPLPVEVQERFEKATGAKLVEGYGMTELSPVSHSTPIYGKRKAGSIGIPFPGVEARIVDLESGEHTLPTEAIGELVVRGPIVMQGYYRKENETAYTIRDGWLYTGDIARMDEDGFFYIVDRKKDMILSNGFNVYPRDVEEVLFMHPAVKDAVVVGIPNERGDTTVKAYIVLKDEATATEHEIVEFCRERMARYKAPRQVEFRETLPKTLVGKTLRRVLVEEEKQKLEVAGGVNPTETPPPTAPVKKPRRLQFNLRLPVSFGPFAPRTATTKS